jgi:hypothetical protein
MTDAAAKFSFIPEKYEAPAASGGEFLNMPEDGKSIRFIPLSTFVAGWFYWDTNKVKHRSPDKFETTPGIKEDDKVRHFWMLHVLDLDECVVKILEISQVSVQRDIIAQVEAADYDFTNGTNGFRIKRTGKGMMDTKYTTTPTPLKTEEEIAAFKAVDRAALKDLAKFAFEKREPKSDVTEVVPDVM